MKQLFRTGLITFALLLGYAGASFAGTVWSVTIGNYPARRPVVRTVLHTPAVNYVVTKNCRPRRWHRLKRHKRVHRVVYTPAVIITPAGYVDYNIHVTGAGFYLW